MSRYSGRIVARFGWVGILLALGAGRAWALPSYSEVKASYEKSEAMLLDRKGRPLQEWRVNLRARRLDWVKLEAISPALRELVISAEDRRFYSHHGVDWHAIAGALWAKARHGTLRGASTLSMQLAGFLEPRLRAKKGRRGLWQKWRQMEAAWDLEKRWTKDQILEAYLNLVSFRGELQGVAAASRGLFAKDPHGLGRGEAAVLAALLRAPNARADELGARACRLWRKDEAQTCEEMKELAKGVVAKPYRIEPRVWGAPHVAARLFASSANAGRKTIRTTLDRDLQQFAQESLRHHLAALRTQNVGEGAVLVVENRTGNVLAYVGNAGDVPSENYVDGVTARRQAGSTLKPFLYGLAFEERLLTPASLVDDSPLDVSVERGVYQPGNYDNQFHGLVTARTALASSLNVPAVRTVMLVGPDQMVATLERVGVSGLKSGAYYGPSLALGTADVTLWDMVGAYRALARGGVWSSVHLMPEEPKGSERRGLSEGAAFLVSDILSDRDSRSLTFGLENPLATGYWAAVKTGTSKDMRDNWCFGYTEHFTVGVWVGNFSGEPMWNVSGISGAAPVWAEIVGYLERTSKREARPRPSEVVARSVKFANGRRRTEYFLKGTETESVEPRPVPAREHIVSPARDTIIALDPDIPPAQERVWFQAETAGDELRWRLNGEELGAAERGVGWQPRAGQFRLELVDKDGKVRDAVRFQVRGGGESAGDAESLRAGGGMAGR